LAATLILGPAGAGKTSRLLEAAAARVRSGCEAGDVLFLSPSAAASALAKRLLTGALGGATLGVRFETFAQLSRRVLSGGGRPPGRPADRALQAMLAAGVISREAAGLGVLRRIAPAPGLPAAVVDFTAELAASAVEPPELARAAARVEGLPPAAAEHLAETCRDLGVLSTGLLDALREAGCSTRETVARDAAALASEGGHLPAAAAAGLVLVDGFGRFSPAELRLLSALAREADETLISLTWDRDGERPFEDAERTRRALADNLPGCTEERLPPEPGSRAPGLDHLERSLFLANAEPYRGEDAAVQIIPAAGEEMECRLVVRRILELRESGECEFGEVGVFMRNPELYAGLLRDECRRTGVPLDAPGGAPASAAPSVELLERWTEAAFAPPAEVDLVACMRGSAGAEELWAAQSAAAASWPAGPRLDEADVLAEAAGDGAGDAVRACAAEIRALRDEFNPGGAAERDGVSPADFRGAAEAVARLLGLPLPDAPGPDARVRADSVAAAAYVGAVGECARALAEAGVEKITYRDFRARLAPVLDGRTASSGSAPARAVVARSVFEARTPPLKVAFVMGLAEGRFPARRREGPFISDRDRERLSDALGRELAPGRLRAYEEDLLFYIAATRPTARLILTHPATDADGKDALPSIYIEEVAAIFGELPGIAARPVIEAVPPLGAVRSPSEARAVLALELSSPARPAADAKKRLRRAVALHDALRREMPGLDLSSAAPRRGPAFGRLREGAAIEWVRKRSSRPMGPTRIEEFTQCAFRHLVTRLLELEPEPEPGFTPLAEGLAMHHALKAALEAARGRPLTEADAEEMIAAGTAALDEHIERELGAAALTAGARARRELLSRRLARLVRHEVELAGSTPFVPSMFELGFGPKSGTPLVIADEAGDIALTGRIDRIDTCETGGERFALALDYKRGSVGPPDLKRMRRAEKAQVPIYAMAVGRALGMRLAASLLYSTTTLERRGILAKGVEETGEAAVAGVTGKKGKLSDDGLAGLISECEESIRRAAAGMRSGRITILPADNTRCRTCDARDICRYDRWEWWGALASGELAEAAGAPKGGRLD